jgi:intein-encoded DNA endonuclease-like protein
MKNYFNEIEIINLYKTGKTQQQIADLYNTYNTSIRRILLRNKIIPRSPEEIGITKRYVKENCFLNKEDKDYWIGILATDGCCQKNKSVVLAVSKKDIELLNKFKNFLGGNVNIIKDPKDIVRISFRNPEIYTYLNSIGISPNKSLTLDIKIPLNFDIIRGIIDGDGSVHKTVNSVSIYSSSIKFIFKINNFLTSHSFQTKLTVSTKNRKNPFYGVHIYGIKQLKGLYNFLYYKENITCLERKRISILNKINSIDNSQLGSHTQ